MRGIFGIINEIRFELGKGELLDVTYRVGFYAMEIDFNNLNWCTYLRFLDLLSEWVPLACKERLGEPYGGASSSDIIIRFYVFNKVRRTETRVFKKKIVKSTSMVLFVRNNDIIHDK